MKFPYYLQKLTTRYQANIKSRPKFLLSLLLGNVHDDDGDDDIEENSDDGSDDDDDDGILINN